MHLTLPLLKLVSVFILSSFSVLPVSICIVSCWSLGSILRIVSSKILHCCIETAYIRTWRSFSWHNSIYALAVVTIVSSFIILLRSLIEKSSPAFFTPFNE